MMTFEQACEAVLTSCPDPYAKAYAKAGLEQMEDAASMYGRTVEEAKTGYILQLDHWRGDLARSSGALAEH